MSKDDAASKPLTERQKKFAELYAADADGKKAALGAGYSSKTADSQASQLLNNPKVVAYLRSLTEPERNDRIATARERQEFWTSLMRGQVDATFVTREGLATGKPDHAARLKASELLGKVQGDFKDADPDPKKSGLDALMDHLGALRRLRESES